MPPDNITLNPANKRTFQSLFDFQTCIGAAAHATLDTEQLISDRRTSLVDSIASAQGFDVGVIAASEVHELLTQIHHILCSAVSKQVGNLTNILAYLFYSASRQHHEVWACQFPFLHSIKDYIPHKEVCL